MHFSMDFHEFMERTDRWSWQPALSPPSFGQGIPASNGLTRTVVAGMAFDFSHSGDEKFEFNEIQVGPSEKPDVHLSKLFLVQMTTLAGIKCDSVRVSRGIDYISKFNITTSHPKCIISFGHVCILRHCGWNGNVTEVQVPIFDGFPMSHFEPP